MSMSPELAQFMCKAGSFTKLYYIQLNIDGAGLVCVCPTYRYGECGPVFVIFYFHRPAVITMNAEDIQVCINHKLY